MRKSHLINLVLMVVGTIFILSGCASLEKARSLHRQGKNDEALNMAQKYLDEDEEENVRLEAVNLIGKIGGERAGEMLMPLLNDPMLAVKNGAIRNIGLVKYAPAAQPLVTMAPDAKGDTFDDIAGAIRSIGPPAIDLLVKKYNSTGDSSTKDKYTKVILAVGPSVAASITKTMAGKTFFENRGNFEILVAFKNPLTAKWMLEDLENEEVAEMVVEGLVKLGSMSANPVIAKLNKTKGTTGNENLKERLIRVLGEIKSQSAVSVLEEMTTDDSDRVRDAANLALRKIRGF